MVWVAAAALLGLAVALLVVPVRLRCEVDTTAGAGEPIATVHVHWLVISWRAVPSAKPKVPRHARPTRPRSSRRTGGGRRALLAGLGSPDLMPSVLRLVRDMARPLSPRRASVWLRAGTGDPSQMGPWYPAMLAVAGLPWPETYRVRVEPDFVVETFEVRACVEWSIRVVALAGPVARFGVSPAVWRAGWAAVRGSRAA